MRCGESKGTAIYPLYTFIASRGPILFDWERGWEGLHTPKTKLEAGGVEFLESVRLRAAHTAGDTRCACGIHLRGFHALPDSEIL